MKSFLAALFLFNLDLIEGE